MKSLIRTTILMAIAAALLLAFSPVPARAQAFRALLNGGQEVPPVTTTAFGVADMTFDGVDLCYTIIFSHDLTSPETAAHFHAPAAPGANAAVRFPISPAPSPFGTPKTGCVVGPVTPEDIDNLVGGLTYINVHTSMNPGGEIRGQVQLLP